MAKLHTTAKIYEELLAIVDQAPKNDKVLVSCKLIIYDMLHIYDNPKIPYVDFNEYLNYLLDMQEGQSKEQMEWLEYQAPLFRQSVEEFIKEYTDGHEINLGYGLPQAFFEEIEPYITGNNPPTIENRTLLIKIWHDALEYRKKYPELQETIAEWSFSATAGSLLIENDPLLDAIRMEFGALEDYDYTKSDQDRGRDWSRLEELITELAALK